MPRHSIGDFEVEVLHRWDQQNGKVSVAVHVFRGKKPVEQAVFAFNGLNSGELRRELPSLTEFYVQKLAAVIDDAREWPRIYWFRHIEFFSGLEVLRLTCFLFENFFRRRESRKP